MSTSARKFSADAVTQTECNTRSRNHFIALLTAISIVLGSASAFLWYGLDRCKEVEDQADAVKEETTDAIADLETAHEKSMGIIVSQVTSHEAAQVETMRRVDGSLGRIEDALKDQSTELKEQRGMIQTIIRNGNGGG